MSKFNSNQHIWKDSFAMPIRLLEMAVCLSVLWWLNGCSLLPPPKSASQPFHPPVTFTEVDIIGHWQPSSETDTRATLVLYANHTFLQTFRSVNGSPVYQSRDSYTGEGTWRIEQRASGCVYLHLEGMKFFYGGPFEKYGNRLSPTDDPYPFWEACEERYIQIPDKMILTVIDRSNFPRNVGLLYPSTEGGRVRGPILILSEDAIRLPK